MGAFVVEFKIISVLVLYVVVVVALSMLQSYLIGILRDGFILGPPATIAMVIAFNNSITALILAMSSHVIFNVVAPLHVLRCSILQTFDCRLSPLMLRFKFRSALALLPVIMLALLIGNMARWGLPVTPHTLIQTLTLGLTRVYGVLELAGYILAYTAPLMERVHSKMVVALSSLTMIILGAILETILIACGP